MNPFQSALALLAALLVGMTAVPAADDAEDAGEEIPLVDRPADLPFSGASGRFTVAIRAQPTRLPVEAPLLLTWTIRASGPVRQPPRRIDLHELPEVAEAFYIEDLPDSFRHPEARTWELLYQLRPRRADVKEVPGLPFVFYNRDIPQPSKRFQVLYTDPVPIEVLPAQEVEVPLAAPEWACTVPAASDLLRPGTLLPLPGVQTWLLVLLVPPLACGLVYRYWHWRYPDAARRARQRRSQAARLALRHLHGLDRLPPDQSGAGVAGVLADYLHQRLDLASSEPTPREAALLLQHSGCTPELAARLAGLLGDCDRARFSQEPSPSGTDLVRQAAALILEVEEQA